MSEVPFPDNAWLTYREATQRWGLQTRKDQAEYIRKDASDAAIAAARAEGVREGMLKAAEIAEPPLMHRKGNIGIWRRRRADIAADIRTTAEAQP
ncbi:MAG: hypothetical protein QM523_00880 [Candidatus Pacebacteria bacterium]|nr:hypothetical protein [Candidatus Paceibacterota bacterium]